MALKNLENLEKRRWLTIRETCQLYHLSEKSLYRSLRCGRVPGTKIKGIGCRVDKLKLDALLEGTAPIPELKHLEPAKPKRGRSGKR